MANSEPDVATRLKSSNLPGVVRLVKMSNMLNALLLCVAGVFAFILNSLSPLVIISGLYIIIFSCMLCCFELHLARFEKAIFRNFGFMFKWGGRCAFFFFVGTLAFGVGIVGIVAGAYTFVNVFLNIYVLRKNPYYKKYVEQQEAEMMTKAYSGQTNNISIIQTAKTAAKIAKKTNMSASQAAAVGAVVVGIAANEQMNTTAPTAAPKKGKKQEWVQYMDEESGQPYWHNPATNETTWEHP